MSLKSIYRFPSSESLFWSSGSLPIRHALGESSAKSAVRYAVQDRLRSTFLVIQTQSCFPYLRQAIGPVFDGGDKLRTRSPPGGAPQVPQNSHLA